MLYIYLSIAALIILGIFLLIGNNHTEYFEGAKRVKNKRVYKCEQDESEKADEDLVVKKSIDVVEQEKTTKPKKSTTTTKININMVGSCNSNDCNSEPESKPQEVKKYIHTEKGEEECCQNDTKPGKQESEQDIIMVKARNCPYTKVEPTPINNTYKMLVKDPVETKVREEAEKNAGITHMRPDIRDPYVSDGYTYINPALWTVGDQFNNRPPICIPQKGYEAEVQPNATTGTPLDAIAWQENLPKYTYNQVYDPRYYYPNYVSSY